MRAGGPFGLFAVFGVEIEYMIVDAATLDVRPLADALIEAEVGAPEQEIERGAIAWSNELARHVIELKTNGPVPTLTGLAAAFQAEVRHVGARLEPLGARLLPTAMHPWMDPERDFELWPHGDRQIYQAFHRIFDCRGHGWANLQSVHLNLPFADDAEFARLHAAVRVALPLIPALAASSPLREGRATGWLDSRLEAYRGNARRVPSVTGHVVPDPAASRAAYERDVLGRIYRDLAPLDPEGVLRHEWVNARGCIARFDRGAIEIRVTDVQECPRADLAVAVAVLGAVRRLARRHAEGCDLEAVPTGALAALLDETARSAEQAPAPGEYARLFGLEREGTAGDLWKALLDGPLADEPELAEHEEALAAILERGPLARCILRRAGAEPARDKLRELYRELAACLAEGRLFDGAR